VDEQGGLNESMRRMLAQIKQEQHALSGPMDDLESQLTPSFDSMEDLELRAKRLRDWFASRTKDEITAQHRASLDDIEAHLHSALLLAETRHCEASLNEVLADLRTDLRRMEVAVGIERRLAPHAAKRTKGAGGC
jgi:hypothetical protein